MADGVPAVFIPPIRALRSNNGRSRAKQISANDCHIDTDNMLIDRQILLGLQNMF
jgi:hypothetical protein